MSFSKYSQVFSLMTLVLVLAAGGAVAESELRVVAKVDGVPITVSDLQREFQRLLPLKGGYHSGVPQERMAEIQEEALQNLIVQAYKVRYALQEEIAVDNAEVEKRLEAIRSRYGSREEFEKALGEESLNELRASIYRYLLAEAAEEAAVDSRVKVTDEEIQAFYEKHQETYQRPKRFRASHILVRVDPASNKEEKEVLKERAEELAGKAKAGEDFYNLAYYNSDDRTKMVGGDLGYFHMGQAAPEFENALLELEEGEISEPVKTRWGYHIIKLVDIDPSRQMTFEEVRPKIRERMEVDRREALYEAWMSDLRERYPVERYIPES